jgi:hypothetical protein
MTEREMPGTQTRKYSPKVWFRGTYCHSLSESKYGDSLDRDRGYRDLYFEWCK